MAIRQQCPKCGLGYFGWEEHACPTPRSKPVSREKPAIELPTAKGKRGRPKTGVAPWKERNREKLKAYMREYMRRRRLKSEV